MRQNLITMENQMMYPYYPYYDGRHQGRGMAATGIGLGAGLGGAALIGVFLTAIFTKRGNTASVLAAIIVGALIIIPLMFQKQFFGQTYIAWCWWCPIGGIISTLICLAGKPKKQQA